MLRITRRMREGCCANRISSAVSAVTSSSACCRELPARRRHTRGKQGARRAGGADPDRRSHFDTDAAIGIVVYPDHGTDPQTLVRNAKLAARAARDAPGRTAVYDPVHGESEERQMRYETRLRHALEQNTLGLIFEPQLDAQSGRIGGWNVPCTGLTSNSAKCPKRGAGNSRDRRSDA